MVDLEAAESLAEQALSVRTIGAEILCCNLAFTIRDLVAELREARSRLKSSEEMIELFMRSTTMTLSDDFSRQLVEAKADATLLKEDCDELRAKLASEQEAADRYLKANVELVAKQAELIATNVAFGKLHDEVCAKLAEAESIDRFTTDVAVKILIKELEALREVERAVRAMKENLICSRLKDGTEIHGWYTVAPCEYGESVDDALAAVDALRAEPK